MVATEKVIDLDGRGAPHTIRGVWGDGRARDRLQPSIVQTGRQTDPDRWAAKGSQTDGQTSCQMNNKEEG